MKAKTKIKKPVYDQGKPYSLEAILSEVIDRLHVLEEKVEKIEVKG